MCLAFELGVCNIPLDRMTSDGLEDRLSYSILYVKPYIATNEKMQEPYELLPRGPKRVSPPPYVEDPDPRFLAC